MLSISFSSFFGIIFILPSVQLQFRGMCERGQNAGIMLQPFICFLPGISNGNIPLIYFFFPPPINLTPVDRSKPGGPVVVPMPLPPYPVLTSRRPRTTTESDDYHYADDHLNSNDHNSSDDHLNSDDHHDRDYAYHTYHKGLHNFHNNWRRFLVRHCISPA
ncbi:unnamed protein product [Allacma fusca]|uniref:Uncharacterized protein n=1 Tax=Allacma fusca TaxID=39272 RepID=A0A8J2KRC5_9HEXA|nr:unnamed protein product [Allacma fusca]